MSDEQPVEYYERCPRCGSTLITNGRVVWCTYVGGRDKRQEPGCDFRATLKLEPEIDPAVEVLAAYAHEAWSGWMDYLFSKCIPGLNCEDELDGSLVIPPWAVERWQRQMLASYDQLSESEKESDRKEARAMLKIMARIYEGNAKRPVGQESGESNE